MTNLAAEAYSVKHVISAAGIVVALLFDTKFGPAEDDLPVRFKLILAAPVVVSIYYAETWPDDRRIASISYAFILLIISVIVYMAVWLLFGYSKVNASQRKWWKPWSSAYIYQNTRVMGGRLTDEAKRIIHKEQITPQDYFEGTAYDQDLVWTRGSRTLLQIVLVLSYISVAFFYTGTIALIAR